MVTIDAMGCQKNLAEIIIEAEADYLLVVKDNQPNLHKAIPDYFEEANFEDKVPPKKLYPRNDSYQRFRAGITGFLYRYYAGSATNR